MAKRQTLGKGFDALIPKDLDTRILETDKDRIQKILITDITPNPDQPRREFEKGALEDLAASIARHGMIQPIIVSKSTKAPNRYLIVAGERRWRAAQLANLVELPAIVRSLEELEQLEVSLIENIQRVDLSPLEQALAVLKLQHQFNLTIEQIAKRLGKAPSTVSNLTRLLQLPESAREALRQSKIVEGHARAILALRGQSDKQEELLRYILDNGWTVRQAEEYVIKLRKASQGDLKSDEQALAADLSKNLKTKVAIRHTAKGGQLIISFKDEAELGRLADSLRG
ncbi:MAG TPA: ParB/RepB/Spo0J family partition protein [Candidatus Saccharimonadales bacterium]|nr:ParB/RepB/Spo0J family partition protein [Candidatus Saccharimonadales bacterium]